jgi:glucan phosphoethanolaminetransferase (alkaline phosphatase superfamily)
MIQRIQSLFLLAACIASFIVVFHPISRMGLSDGSQANLTSIGLKTDAKPSTMLYSAFPIAVLAAICGLMSFVTIIMYRKRLLQMRLCGYNILLTLILIIVIFIYYFIIKHKTIDNSDIIVSSSLSYPIVLPFVNIVLLFQSFRAIRRDDLIIKSYDRLR